MPDYAFEGMGGADLNFDRAAIGAIVFDRSRGIGWGEEDPEMAGVKSFLSNVGKGVGSVVKGVAKGAVNAAASKAGLGPIFGGPTAQIVHVPGAHTGAVPPPRPNYLPYVLGGGALLVAVVLIARR